jgi:hypothetical protein
MFTTWSTDSAEEKWPRLEEGSVRLALTIPPRWLNEGNYRVELLATLFFRVWLIEPGTSASLTLPSRGGANASPYWGQERRRFSSGPRMAQDRRKAPIITSPASSLPQPGSGCVLMSRWPRSVTRYRALATSLRSKAFTARCYCCYRKRGVDPHQCSVLSGPADLPQMSAHSGQAHPTIFTINLVSQRGRDTTDRSIRGLRAGRYGGATPALRDAIHREACAECRPACCGRRRKSR